MAIRFINAYTYDKNGWLDQETSAQEVNGKLLLPANTTTKCPWGTGKKDPNCFYVFNLGEWACVPKPASAIDMVGIVVSHESMSSHDIEMRELVKKFSQEKGFREKRGEDLSWSVEQIPEKTPEELKRDSENQIRSKRDYLISETDRYLLADIYAGLSEEQKKEITSYRQALRDVPQQESFPESVEWPVKPSWIK